MRYSKSLTPSRSLRHLYFGLALGSLFIAALSASPIPMKTVKADPPRPIQTTTDPCSGLNPPAQICGKWGARVTLKTVPVHITVLPDKRILYWGRDKAIDHSATGDHWDIGDRCNTYVWDPSDLTGGGPTIVNTTTNLFCSSHSYTLDGRLLVAGGHSRYGPVPSTEGIGETDLNIFDPRSLSWTLVGSMPNGRWYPSSVTLGSGETVITSGTFWDGVTFAGLTPFPGVNKTVDKFALNGGLQSFDHNALPVLWNYPFLHLAPDGKVFIAGPGPEQSRFFDTTNFTAVDGPTYNPPTHYDGSSLVYDGHAGKVMMVGGISGSFGETDQTVNTTETIDLKSSPVWKSSAMNPPQVAAMKRSRRYHLATVLPDGKVLVTGGTQCGTGPSISCTDAANNPIGAVTRPELWTPPSGFVPDEWKLLASSPSYPDYPNGVPRSYHSIGILLPDARVLVGGGGLPAAGGEVVNGTTCKDVEGKNNNPDCLRFGHKDVEIFSPPYLFDSNGNLATRPILAGAPDKVVYGETFKVDINSALPITTVAFIRLPSVTHGTDFDQRRVVVPHVSTGSTSLNVTIPTDNRILPPGPYMMFILDSNGVPSKATIIKVNQLEGRIEAINCDQLRGWAWDLNQPNTPINVTLNIQGIPSAGIPGFTATVTANQFRQDLLNAGKGNGQHGFVFNVPLQVKDGVSRIVESVFTGTRELLSRNIIGSLQCPASLFPTQIPTGTASGEGQTWEQGTQFSSSVSGYISHIAFYKAEGETGTHVGRIWSDTGALLAQVTFTNETPSGWQVQALPSNLAISAGVKYRVTYNVNNLVAKIFAGLNSPITNGPLTAHTSFFSTPAGTFPTTNSGSILFADVRFWRPLPTR